MQNGVSQGQEQNYHFSKIWNQASDTNAGSVKISISCMLNNRSRVWKHEFAFSWNVYLRAKSAIEIVIFSIKSNFLRKNKLCVYGHCFLLSTGTSDWVFVEPIGPMCLTLLVKLKSPVIGIGFCKGILWYGWFYLQDVLKSVPKQAFVFPFLCR